MAQSDFIKAFEAINLPDGRPDGVTRRKRLSDLIPVLSSDEIRYMRNLLHDIILYKDICANLPVELLLRVARYLSLEDILKFRTISRSWHDAFSGPDFCLAIFQQRFPGPFQECLLATQNQGSKATTAVLEHFHTMLFKCLRRKHGCYASKALYRYDFDHQSELPREQQYSNGRVALRLNGYGVVVRDLRTASTRQIIEPDRIEIRSFWLTDQFLIYAKAGSASLSAWSLVEENETCRIRLPTGAKRVSGRGSLIGIITTSGGVLLWTIGEGLVIVDTSLIPSETKRLDSDSLGMILPQDRVEFYATLVQYPDEDHSQETQTQRIIVRGYLNDKKTDYHLDIPFEDVMVGVRNPAWAGNALVWCLHPRDRAIARSSELTEANTCQRCAYKASTHSTDKSITIYVAFDIITRSFSFQSYHFPRSISRGYVGPASATFWKGQALVPVSHWRESHFDSLKPEDCLIVAVDVCRLPHPIPSFNEYQREQNDKLSRITDDAVQNCYGTPGLWLCEEKFTQDMSSLIEPYVDYYDQWLSGVSVYCDDDFVVLLALTEGMAVWNFNKKIELPSSR